MSNYVLTGATEPIAALIVDITDTPLTGLTDIKMSVRRLSDGKFLDFNDFTFKSAGWTTRQVALSEVDSSNEPGLYSYSFNTGSIVSPAANDIYQVVIRQTSLTNAANVPQICDLHMGGFVDTISTNLNATVGSRAATGDAMTLADNAITAAKIASNAITAAKIATDAIGGAQVAADAVTKIQAGLATATALSTVASDVTTIKGYGAPPSAASNASAVWATAVPGAFTSGQAGYVLGTNLDAQVSSRLATSGYTAPPSAVTISAAVVDQALAGHTSSGTVGEALSRADVAVSTRLASTDYTAPPSVADIASQVDTTLSGSHGAGAWVTATVVDLAAGALTATAIGTGYVAALQAGLATSAAQTTAQTSLTDIQGRIPASLVSGRMDASVGAMQADTLTASALAGSAVTEIQAGLATATNVSDAQTAINGHTDSAVSGLAQQATLVAGVSAILADVDGVPAGVWATAGRTLTAFTGAPLTSVVQGVWGEALPGSYGAGTAGAKLGTPAAVTIADDGISAAAVSAAAVTKIQSGLALATTLNDLMGAGFTTATDSLHALRARGDSAWTTANVASLATTAQLDAHALAIKGASFDTATDSLHALKGLLSALPTAAQIWAYDISGNATLTQAGGALYGLKVLGFNRMEETAGNPGTLLAYADDGVTVRFTFNLRDATGGAVSASVGEPARRSAVA